MTRRRAPRHGRWRGDRAGASASGTASGADRAHGAGGAQLADAGIRGTAHADHRRRLPSTLLDPLIESGRLYADARANAVFVMLAGNPNRPVGAELWGSGLRVWRGMASASRVGPSSLRKSNVCCTVPRSEFIGSSSLFFMVALDLPNRLNENGFVMIGSLAWPIRPCIKFLSVDPQFWWECGRLRRGFGLTNAFAGFLPTADHPSRSCPDLVLGFPRSQLVYCPHERTPRTLSFAGATQVVAGAMTQASVVDGSTQAKLADQKLESIASHRVGHRPDRVEPRAIKRRPKGHKLLTKPRDEARAELRGTAAPAV